MARRRVPSWLTAAAALALGLAATEGLLRLGGFEYAHTPLALRYVGSIAHAGHSQASRRGDYRIDYALDRELLWRPVRTEGVTNSQGFLGPEWGAATPGRRRLIALGDSCTVAGDPPYPERLGRRLGRRWEVLNAGVGSWSSYQGSRLLERLLRDHRPSVVTIYFGWNDHWLAWAAPDKRLSELLDRQWSFHQAVRRVKLLQLWLRAAAALKGGAFTPTASTPPRVALPDYEDNLRRMIASCRAAGAAPVLLTAPTSLTPSHPVTRLLADQTRNFFDPARINSVHDAYNAVVRRVAADTRAPLVDLAADFARREDLPALFTDGIHLNDAGHAAAAEAIARAVSRL
jgi:lysophospholipase L1-like esterase